jgi:ubiquinone/menaquinone biosynthesis C-methylase UbiE
VDTRSVRLKLFATLYDPVMRGLERKVLAGLRRQVVSQSRGVVVEIGAGTGANLPFYPGVLESLLLTEPDHAMFERLAHKLPMGVLAERAPAETLPVADGSVDTVVSTLALCTVDDPSATLAEFRRVLRPQGRLLFIEHVRSAARGSPVGRTGSRARGGSAPRDVTRTAIR